MKTASWRLNAKAPSDILNKLSAEPPKGAPDEDTAKSEIVRLADRLSELQELLFADGRHAMLVVLQAMDTGGKDGTIRRVFSGLNPAGVTVARFEAPTKLELAHDFLWRVHAQAPAKGQIMIFNRSHYEDVLVVRVNDLAPRSIWRHRYDHIRAFESLLAGEGTTIVKFYLHISFEEQRQRLQARLDEPNKQWKFDAGDLDQRAQWPQYMRAFRDALVKTDRPHAPWYVIPANRKWYRDYAIMRVLVDTLEGLDLRYPEPQFTSATMRVD